MRYTEFLAAKTVMAEENGFERCIRLDFGTVDRREQ